MSTAADKPVVAQRATSGRRQCLSGPSHRRNHARMRRAYPHPSGSTCNGRAALTRERQA